MIQADTLPLYPPRVTPAKRKLPGLQYVARLVQNPLRTVPESVYREPIVPYANLRMPLAWVTGPDLISQVLLEETDRYLKTPVERRILGPTLGDGLLTASGASWRWQRKVAAPLFRHADLLAYVPHMLTAGDDVVTGWRAEGGPSGRPFTTDVGAAMKVATFDVIASTILAGCLPHEASAIKRADTAYMAGINWELAAAVVGLPETMWHPAKRSMQRAARDGRAAVLGIVQRRRTETASTNGAPQANDVLTRLLAARHPDTAEPMTDAMIVDNLATFLEAGHLTTAQALTWTLYLLARAPQWQDRVRSEIIDVTRGGPITDPVAQLPVTTRLFKEAMRLYPPVPTMVRIADSDAILGGTPIPKGTTIVISIYTTHRHRSLWDDPDRFDPDRFLPEREALMQRGQYMPFGFGQRTCIGMTYAMMEGIAILSRLVPAAQFNWDGHHLPEPLSRLTLTPRGGMPLQVQIV